MDNLRVNFVSQGNAQFASHRMRVLRPVELMNVGIDGIDATITRNANPDVDVNIFSKHFDYVNNKKDIDEGRIDDYITVFDVCDDHFDRAHGEYYEFMCNHADTITCNTPNMQERIYEVTGRLSRIIPDPITFPYSAPVFSRATPSLLWFGHSLGVGPLIDWLDYLDQKVTVITNQLVTHPKLEFIQWRPDMVEHKIFSYDIVLIPTGDEPWIKCKSPNRAVDAIQAGKFVVTNNRDIYGHLEDYLVIIDSPEELPDVLEYWSKNQEGVKERILAGQKYIKEHYSNDIVIDRWLDVFQDLDLIKGYENG